MNTRISCCMIVKDEERFIKGCISSIIREVDEIVLVDTGSKDATPDIARSFGDKVKIYSFKWNDNFSDARNFSLSKATGDWILYLDADERLNTLGRRGILKDLAGMHRADAYISMIRNFSLLDDGSFNTSIGYAVRFFRNIEGLRFESAVHEEIITSLKQHNARFEGAPFIIDHLGYYLSPAQWRKKHERNIALSLKELEKNPEDARILYHLALSYYLAKDVGNAWKYVEKAHRAIKSHNGEEIICGILNLKAWLLLEKKRFQEALDIAKASLKVQSRQNTANLIIGTSLYFLGRSEEAIPFVRKVLQYQESMGNPMKHPSRLSHEFVVSLQEVKKLLANCYFDSKRYREALEIVESGIDGNSNTFELIRFAGICAFRAGMWGKAEGYLTNYLLKADDGKEILPYIMEMFKSYVTGRDTVKIMSLLDAVSRSKKWIEYTPPFFNVLSKAKLLNDVVEKCKEQKKLRLLVVFYMMKGKWSDVASCARKLAASGDKEAEKVYLFATSRLNLKR